MDGSCLISCLICPPSFFSFFTLNALFVASLAVAATLLFLSLGFLACTLSRWSKRLLLRQYCFWQRRYLQVNGFLVPSCLMAM